MRNAGLFSECRQDLPVINPLRSVDLSHYFQYFEMASDERERKPDTSGLNVHAGPSNSAPRTQPPV